MTTPFEEARTQFMAGLQAQEAGRLPDAEAAYRASLALVPGRASTLNNLGVVLTALQRDEEALPLLEQALQVEPGDAATWVVLGQCQARLGDLPAALVSADQALTHAADLAAAWALRGGVLKDLGRPVEAAAALRSAMAHGADPALQGYLLASIEGHAAPPQPPPGYVQALFDGYAGDFDRHLVGRLAYQAPQTLVGHLAAQLQARGGQRLGTVLDLGCGTGLCGPLLRPLAQRLVGVDLSAGMLHRAHARGCYDELVQDDVAEHLHSLVVGSVDAVVAADVFIYVGDLQAVFAGVRRVLAPGGWFALSVEEAPDAVDFELRTSSRYAQSARYLHRLAAEQGLLLQHEHRGPLRQDQGQDVIGLYQWWQQST
jgi:predicted TPR repeat methyltransferase